MMLVHYFRHFRLRCLKVTKSDGHSQSVYSWEGLRGSALLARTYLDG
jgi:hypothetical protein